MIKLIRTLIIFRNGVRFTDKIICGFITSLIVSLTCSFTMDYYAMCVFSILYIVYIILTLFSLL